MSSLLPATNFQDLSALLSVFASDNVEQKLGNQSSYDWERMSSVWSTFGMIGVLRFYLKITAGLANSERAGVNLAGAAIYTARRTESALCYWGVNRADTRVSWRDKHHELLSLMHDSAGFESAWLRPIFIAIGYSRCPWNWRSPRCIMELIIPFLWAILSLAITILPTLILFPALHSLTTIQVVTLYLQSGTSVFAGTVVPIIIDRFNTSGVEHLAQLHHDRLVKKPIPLVRAGDLVMAQSTNKEAHIIWQTPNIEEFPRSGDIWWIRVLSALNCLLILGAYLGNYISLGSASKDRQYLWLATQIVILISRYGMWSIRPILSPQRPPCLLYIATGSLVDPISAIPPPERIPADFPGKLSLIVIQFAVAAAMSRTHSREASTSRYLPELYARMADRVPCDFISVEYILMADFFDKAKKTTMTVRRLSWAVVEECYAAQGVILGPNPWAFGGLYLGAVFLDDTFVGLTTVHPFQLHVQNCTDKVCAARHEKSQNGGFTRDGYFIDDLVHGTVDGSVCDTAGNVCAWHDMFRSNVSRCRSTAKTNGPSYTEIHATTSSLRPRIQRINVSRVEPTLNYDIIQASTLHASTKQHHDCRPDLCEIYTFGGNDVRLLAPQNST